jgi:hypothetical protein
VQGIESTKKGFLGRLDSYLERELLDNKDPIDRIEDKNKK